MKTLLDYYKLPKTLTSSVCLKLVIRNNSRWSTLFLGVDLIYLEVRQQESGRTS